MKIDQTDDDEEDRQTDDSQMKDRQMLGRDVGFKKLQRPYYSENTFFVLPSFFYFNTI